MEDLSKTGGPMEEELWTVEEVIDFFRIEAHLLSDLEEEEIVCPICSEQPPTKLFPQSELEKVRIAKVLYEDMGVNLPGIEIILRMRQGMLDMRMQFDGIMEDLARDLRERLEHGL